jgi:class 3 adenylate cyclase
MRVVRCFAFVDLSDFTAFTEHNGDEHTVAVLAGFRTRIREIAARRGVRVTKWLGDGAMLSSADAPAVVAMAMELAATDRDRLPLEVRTGLAQGPVIMFEGDDYIGRPANVASRLCDAATPGQILAAREVASLAPRWVAVGQVRPYLVHGIDRAIEASVLTIAESETMVTDPCCGLVLPEIPGLDTRFGPDNSVARFCSTACALSWDQRPKDLNLTLASETTVL